MKIMRNKSQLLVLMVLLGSYSSAYSNADGCMFRVAVNSEHSGVSKSLDTTVSQKKESTSLYKRLGGYDAIVAVSNDLVERLVADPQLGRFWAHRGEDGIKREKQLLIDFIVDRAGGPLFYGGRDMVTTHVGMKISNSDWDIMMAHLNATLEKFKLGNNEKEDVINFIESLKVTMVELP